MCFKLMLMIRMHLSHAHTKTRQEPVENQFNTLMSLHDPALFSAETVKQSIRNLFAHFLKSDQ